MRAMVVSSSWNAAGRCCAAPGTEIVANHERGEQPGVLHERHRHGCLLDRLELTVDLRDVVLRALQAVVLELLGQASGRRRLGRRSCRPSPPVARRATNAALNSPNSTNAAHVVVVGVWPGMTVSTSLMRGGGFLDRLRIGHAAAAVAQCRCAGVAGRRRGRRCGRREAPERRRSCRRWCGRRRSDTGRCGRPRRAASGDPSRSGRAANWAFSPWNCFILIMFVLVFSCATTSTDAGKNSLLPVVIAVGMRVDDRGDRLVGHRPDSDR